MRELMIATLALIVLAAPAVAETRDVSGFEAVNASGRFRVEIAVAADFNVTVEGPDARRIRTRLDGETLKIEPVSRPWFGEPRYNATIRVSLPRLTGVAAARGASVTATAGGECEEFSAAAAMGAELRISDIQCESVDAAAAMGADLRLSGTCETLDVSAAMGATVRAEDLHCQIVDASAAMGADVNAFAEASYDAAASMGADIRIAGGGRSSDRSAVMGGSVTEPK